MLDQYIDYNIDLGYHAKIPEVATYTTTIDDLKAIAKIIGIKLVFEEESKIVWHK